MNLMKTMQTVAKGLSVLCLFGAVAAMLVLHVYSSDTGIFNGVDQAGTAHKQAGVPAVETSLSCSENAAGANPPAKNNQDSKNSIPADMGITRLLTPIISEYVSGLLPRLLH